MDLAEVYARQGTCPRAKVGCVIVANNRQIGAGFNGAPSGVPHCPDDWGCVVDAHCGRSIHAEVNAVLQAMSLAPQLIRGSTAYVTHKPCWYCAAIMRQAGITKVIFKEDYGVKDSRRDFIQEPSRYEIIKYDETTFVAGATVSKTEEYSRREEDSSECFAYGCREDVYYNTAPERSGTGTCADHMPEGGSK